LQTGDYDGDLGLALWQKEIVDSFVPADLKYAEEPREVAGGFSTVNETVPDFWKRVQSQPQEARIRALQQVLLSSIRDTSVVGKYSIFHENATYHLGYDHPETVRLAYM
jgi:RNA-dependent RNA polymerase